MNTLKLMSLSAAAILAFSFSGCSSSSDSGGGNDNPGGSDPIVTDPIVPYGCESSRSIGGQTVTMKTGADGKITCVDNPNFPEFAFVEGVHGLTVSQLVGTLTGSSSEGSMQVDVDLIAGTETYSYGNDSCKITYDITLPIEIDDANDLLGFDMSEYGQEIEDTCDDGDDDDDDDDDYDDRETSGSSLQNITVTESGSGDISKISMFTEVK